MKGTQKIPRPIHLTLPFLKFKKNAYKPPNESNDGYEWLHVRGKVHGLTRDDKILMDSGGSDS